MPSGPPAMSGPLSVYRLFSKGKEFDSVCKLVLLHDFRDELEIAHTDADCHAALRSIDDSGEMSPCLLTAMSFRYEIFVLGEEGAS